MTPVEKAKELMNRFNNEHYPELKEYIIYQSLEESKRCALIAVELALEFCGGNDMNEEFDKIIYLVEVKHEIEQL